MHANVDRKKNIQQFVAFRESLWFLIKMFRSMSLSFTLDENKWCFGIVA